MDTDVIIPARYLNIADPAELAAHAMEDIDAEFVHRVQSGDLIVANRNFGCGSSREHAPMVLKENKVSCVIAASFARIFYRNAINIGLPILECAQAAARIEAGDMVSVDFDSGLITNLTKNETYRQLHFHPLFRRLLQQVDCFRHSRQESRRNKGYGI